MTRTISSLWARRWLVGLGLVLGMGGATDTARAQTDPGQARTKAPRPPLSERRGVTSPSAEPSPASTVPPTETEADKAQKEKETAQTKDGFLGDTKKFTRLGGWGSMGGAMSQFGVARSMLVMMPPVQVELKLTGEQKKRLVEVQEQTRKRGEEIGRTMREKGGDPFRGGENVSVVARVSQFTGMMGQISELMRENENEFAKVLTASQRKRLGQIALQMEGISALTRPEIADELGLYPIEQEEIQRIVAQSRMVQMTSMVGTMMTMRNDRTTRRGPEETTPGQEGRDEARPTPKEADSKTPAAADSKARAEREKAAREKFSSLRENNDRIQDQAVREISRFLNKAQRAKFLNMLGPPFDPGQLTNIGQPPRRPEAKPDDAKKAEAR